MSFWYDYLEETGGEIIPMHEFKHVKKSLCDSCELISDSIKIAMDNFVLALKKDDDIWYAFKIIMYLSEGWCQIIFYQDKPIEHWINVNNNENIKSTIWCKKNNKNINKWDENLEKNCDLNIETIEFMKYIPQWKSIKVGGYLECWVEESLGTVWPVKVLNNIGGRLKLSWFGSIQCTHFYMFYLDYRLRYLGWAKSNNWSYSSPSGASINIAINNTDTFVRGSPCAITKGIGCDFEPEIIDLEENAYIECVNPLNPSIVSQGKITSILDEKYVLVSILESDQNFIGFCNLGTILPANLSHVLGFKLNCSSNWSEILKEEGFAPSGNVLKCQKYYDDNSSYLPGCKLEAVHPLKKDQIHVATITRCLEGSRLIWIHLDSDPEMPDFLVDPEFNCDIFPVGWCQMVGHSLCFPKDYNIKTVSVPIDQEYLNFDNDEILINLNPQCYIGPYISRSAALEILPKIIGPGHCFPVFRELFHLLLKVSSKPFKLMRLLQLDSMDDSHESMAVIYVPMPKLENVFSLPFLNLKRRTNGCLNGKSSNGNNNSSEWPVEIAIYHRAMAEFCRQIALALGACPNFITFANDEIRSCHLHCKIRLLSPLGASNLLDGKLNISRRKHMINRPLVTIGFSYNELKSRLSDNQETKSIQSGSSDTECNISQTKSDNGFSKKIGIWNENTILEKKSNNSNLTEITYRLRMKRKINNVTENIYVSKLKKIEIPKSIKNEESLNDSKALFYDANELSNSEIEYSIDPTYLAGDIERINLTSNPVTWGVEEVAQYLANTKDCRQLASWIAREAIDGQALLLLTLPILRRSCGLQLGPAVKLCRHVASLKRAFIEQYSDQKYLLPS